MYNADTDLLFPPRAIPALREMRGAAWQDLVTGVVEAGPDSPEQMAFILMMARMSNCATCNSDSYRAMHGCTVCATQSLKRFHGADEELSGLFQAARTEVEQYLHKKGNCSTLTESEPGCNATFMSPAAVKRHKYRATK